MFLLIPLILVVASAGGILFIVWRKLPRLKELAEIESNSTAAESSNGASPKNDWRHGFYDLCPEVWNWVRGIKVKEYKEMWLVETEKLLRRLRLASMKMDRFSDSLIKKIRKRTYRPSADVAFPLSSIPNETAAQRDSAQDRQRDDKTEFKKNEQRLIIEIAKNPKNAAFYEELGDLYVKMGDHRDAKESYEAAIELNSNNEELKQKLSSVLEKLNPPNLQN